MRRAIATACTLACLSVAVAATALWLLTQPNSGGATLGFDLLGFAVFPLLPVGIIATVYLGLRDVPAMLSQRNGGSPASHFAATITFTLLALALAAIWCWLLVLYWGLTRI